jgi:hypothetical protein
MLEVPPYVAEHFFTSDSVGGVPMSGVHATQCPVCADYKKRMYLIHDSVKGYRVFCHNCAYSATLLRFVKDFHPQNYERMTSECVSDYVFSYGKKKKKEKEENFDEIENSLKDALSQANSLGVKNKKEVKEKHAAQIYVEKHCVKLTKDCPDSSMIRTIEGFRKVLLDRNIDPSIVDKCYYSLDGDFKKRIIIPFYDKDDNIYYFQGMATEDWQKSYKYLNFDPKKPLYNEHYVDKNKIVYLVEGLWDSTFLDNAVATLGVSISSTKIREMRKKFPNRVWVMDNDKIGKSMTEKLLNMDESCVIFPKKYKKIKDLNELSLLLNENNLTKKIKKFTYNGIDGLLEMTRN